MVHGERWEPRTQEIFGTRIVSSKDPEYQRTLGFSERRLLRSRLFLSSSNLAKPYDSTERDGSDDESPSKWPGVCGKQYCPM
jgi:hypothetical protein